MDCAIDAKKLLIAEQFFRGVILQSNFIFIGGCPHRIPKNA